MRLFALFASFLYLLTTGAVLPVLAQSGVTMSLDPATKNVAPGQNFSLDIKISNPSPSKALVGADAILTYDSDKLEYIAHSGNQSGYLFYQSSNQSGWSLDNLNSPTFTAGTVSIGGGISPGSNAVTGFGKFITVTFKVKGTAQVNSTTSINFLFTQIGNTTDTNVASSNPAEGDILQSVTGGSYSIIQGSQTSGALSRVAVQPDSSTLQAGFSQPFNAIGYDQNNQAVSGLSFTWTISPNLGSVSSSGFYTAPSSISAVSTVTVSASATKDGITKTGLATIALMPAAAATPATTPPVGMPLLVYPLLLPGSAGLAYLLRRRIKF